LIEPSSGRPPGENPRRDNDPGRGKETPRAKSWENLEGKNKSIELNYMNVV
jgi:hypothetical protein